MNLKTILPFLLLLLLGTAGSSQASLILTTPPSASVNVGDTFDALVLIEGQFPVAAYAFDITFPTFLQVLADPVEQGFFSGNGCCFSWNEIDNTNGVISGISDFSGTPDPGSDVLVDIAFTAVGTGIGQIAFDNISLSDIDGNSIPYLIVNDTVVIASAAEQTSPSTPEPGTWALAASGAAALAAFRRKTRRAQADS